MPDKEKRIIATFVPQAWIDDYAIVIEGEVEFDVTDQILEMGKEKALLIRDDKHESDLLWMNSGGVTSADHHYGPYYVLVEQAIQGYFKS